MDKCKTTHNKTRFITCDTTYSVHLQLVLPSKINVQIIELQILTVKKNHVEVFNFCQYKYIYACIYIQTGIKFWNDIKGIKGVL